MEGLSVGVDRFSASQSFAVGCRLRFSNARQKSSCVYRVAYGRDGGAFLRRCKNKDLAILGNDGRGTPARVSLFQKASGSTYAGKSGRRNSRGCRVGRQGPLLRRAECAQHRRLATRFSRRARDRGRELGSVGKRRDDLVLDWYRMFVDLVVEGFADDDGILNGRLSCGPKSAILRRKGFYFVRKQRPRMGVMP